MFITLAVAHVATPSFTRAGQGRRWRCAERGVVWTGAGASQDGAQRLLPVLCVKPGAHGRAHLSRGTQVAAWLVEETAFGADSRLLFTSV